MSSEKIDELLTAVCAAPDSQIDTTIVVKINALIGLPSEKIATELKSILDECAHASLASDFAMTILDTAMDMANEEAEKKS